jgi:hypothetical protein
MCVFVCAYARYDCGLVSHVRAADPCDVFCMERVGAVQESSLTQGMLRTIAKHVDHFPAMTTLKEKRERKHLDVDSYQRKVDAMEKSDKEEYVRKESKLRVAEQTFAEVHQELADALSSYEAMRPHFLSSDLASFFESQLDYFRLAHSNLESMSRGVAALAVAGRAVDHDDSAVMGRYATDSS